ncbi:prepilin peptidase [Leifsonia shinshuensis]|uniref:Prepilin leader peptidase/N-methyltransferase n=1 Tax=Leifsonia shinshuensis TaxID=150026 RepID=A0A853CWQ8_9MICO|nr:A24 family peptidase [Leifsonia shinshuensis]NYJ23005.1 leader peptidase (prepilin peptidase)/N-methyltransferase [Leifsonia shinshuensis]
MTLAVFALALGFVVVFGALIGSFLNVVVYRVPAGRSIVSPPSACGSCGTEIKPYDNVPVLSWLVLRGRCRSCRGAISVRYPLVEAATGVAFAVVAWWFWAGPQAPAEPTGAALAAGVLEVVAYLYLAAISIALALIDLDTHRLPNTIVLPSYLVGAALLGTASALTGDWGALLGAAIGGAVLYGGYLLLALVYPGGMGFGDVKLAGVLGVFLGYLGWGPLIIGGFAPFVLGGVFALVLLAARRARKGSGIPFGPWMLAGAWLGVLAGPTIWNAYLALLGLA